MRTVPAWSDPTYYVFLTVGLLLLGSAMFCQVQARRGDDAAGAQVAVAPALLLPASHLPPAPPEQFRD